jgi:hypothetical protein
LPDAATQFGSVDPVDLYSVKTIAHPRGGLTCRTNSSNIASARFIANSLCCRRVAQPFRAVIAAPPTYDRRSRSGSLPQLAGMRCASSLMIRFIVFRRQARFPRRRYLYVPD